MMADCIASTLGIEAHVGEVQAVGRVALGAAAALVATTTGELATNSIQDSARLSPTPSKASKSVSTTLLPSR